MKVHEVLLIPGSGWSDNDGRYSRGPAIGRAAEVDVVDKYLGFIADELETAGVRYRILETRKAPGVRLSERTATAYPNTLIVDCRVGFNEGRRIGVANNISGLTFGGKGGREIAHALAQAMFEWGGLYVFGHKNANAVEDNADPLFQRPGTVGVRLEPFKINGPGISDYLIHLDKLGRDLGRTIVTYVHSKLPSAAARIYT